MPLARRREAGLAGTHARGRAEHHIPPTFTLCLPSSWLGAVDVGQAVSETRTAGQAETKSADTHVTGGGEGSPRERRSPIYKPASDIFAANGVLVGLCLSGLSERLRTAVNGFEGVN
jgi:hypothetical protein